jgi:catechol 2,3-dioxygenase-like lactoylglutathione lyase family enzyme
MLELIGVTTRGEIEHVGVEVDDLDAIVGFLESTFGLAVDRRVDIPHRLRAAFLHWGGLTVELIERAGAARGKPPARIDHLAVRVDDLQAEAERLRAAGVSTETPAVVELGGRPTIFVDGSAHGIRLQLVGPPA